MPTPTNIQAELNRHSSQNSETLQRLVEEQFDIEITRSFLLTFTAAKRSDAERLGRLLFAKGMRLLAIEPEQQQDGSFAVRAVVKHSLREITEADFICDLITVASGVCAQYEGWALPGEDAADQDQPSHDSPDNQK